MEPMNAPKALSAAALGTAFALALVLPFVGGRSVPPAPEAARIAAAPEGEAGVGGVAEEALPPEAGSAALKPLFYESYRVRPGDIISVIAKDRTLAQDSLLSLNGITNARTLRIGSYLKIPNQDGILYDARPGDTVDAVAERYGIDPQAVAFVNGLEAQALPIGKKLFLPAARLSRVDLQEINGDLFIWPVKGWISSPYGYRTSPFTGARQFHSGLDIAAPLGTHLKAAMEGRVAATGYDVNNGNYVVVAHHSGYRTFYGHMDVIRVKAGEHVKAGQRIGDVGSTGLSTGSHVHFTVFKHGSTVNPRTLMR